MSLAQLKNALGSVARPNKYRINFSIPAAVPVKSDLANADVLCKAASFPSMTIGQIEVWNQGRKLIIPGDTSFTNTWELTFYQTEDHALRKDLISWMVAADHFQTNTHSGNPNSILGELSVEQLDSAGNATARYTFHNVFVSEVGEVTLGDDTQDTPQEFSCVFSFSDWILGTGEIQNPASGNKATLNEIATR